MESTDKGVETQAADKSTGSELEKPAQDASVFYRSEYAKKEFWNSRFEKQKGFFDWYVEYNELETYFKKIYPIPPDSKILMVGCGNSKLSEEMYDDGLRDIVNIDISDVVVKKMNEHVAKRNKNMKFIEMDATNMTFEDGSFDVVIDKGTLDAVLCGKDISVGSKLLTEMARVCKKDGFLLVITYGGPQLRRKVFKASLGSVLFEYSYCQQNLSSMVQLINIMRNNLGSKPLRSILKDKEALKKSLIEYAKCSKAEKKEITPQSFVLEGIETDETSTDTESKMEENDTAGGANGLDNSDNNGNNIEESGKNDNEAEEEEAKVEENDETEVFQPKRQEFCYIYKIWRKNSKQL